MSDVTVELEPAMPEFVLELPTFKFEMVVPQVYPPQQPDPVPYFSDVHFAKYDATTGRILFLGSVPSNMLELQGDDVVAGVASQDTDYVLAGVLTKRPPNPTVLNGMSLSGLPSPCVINMNGTDYQSTDPTAELSFSQPGTFTVTVTAFPMLDASFEVTQA